MELSEQELNLYKESNKVLEALYSYFEEEVKGNPKEFTVDLMNKMTDAIKACIRYNNVLTTSIKDKIIVLNEKGISLLNSFYNYYDQLPKKENEVADASGQGLMEVYSGIIQTMTPIAMFIISFFDEKYAA